MTCYTASRWGVGRSFAESVVLGGAAACAVGAVADVRHIDNMRWMIGLASALRRGECYVGDALASAGVHLPALARNVYRIIGDPLVPMIGSVSGARRAARIEHELADQVGGDDDAR